MNTQLKKLKQIDALKHTDEWFRLNDLIEQILKQNRSCIIGIDGHCASGKTTLGKLLHEKYACNLFHMDDFYVPKVLKTADRLEIPGGNVHFERFQAEVTLPLINQETVLYRKYLCASESFSPEVPYAFHSITIIEGSYSGHPNLEDPYDLMVFMKHGKFRQQQRILERNGPDVYKRFESEWIPLEMKYFEAYGIEAKSDLVIDTSDMW